MRQADDTITAGYPHAIDALHKRVSPGRLVPSSSGHVLASTAAIPHARPGPLSRLGLAVSTADAADGAGGGRADGGGAAEEADRFARGLLDLHHELLIRALRQVLRQLGQRTSAETTLLSKELIQGQLAEIAMRLSEDEELLAEPRDSGPWARWRTHQRQVAIGRGLLRLFGASGFTADGPGRDLHLAEVTGNVYLHPGSTVHPGPAGPAGPANNEEFR